MYTHMCIHMCIHIHMCVCYFIAKCTENSTTFTFDLDCVHSITH